MGLSTRFLFTIGVSIVLGMRAVMHFHLTFSGLVCLLSLWEAAGAMSFHDPFEGTETNVQSAHFGINEASDEE